MLSEPFYGKQYGFVLGCRLKENSVGGGSSWVAGVVALMVEVATFFLPWMTM